MNYTNARFADAEKTVLVVNVGEHVLTVPAGHRVAEEMRRQGVPIADFVPQSVSAEDVRREASRRMQSLVGARDAQHLIVILSNAQREAIRLLLIGAGQWTAEQAARAAELEASDAAIEAIRAASNAMEASPPADYTDDQYWP